MQNIVHEFKTKDELLSFVSGLKTCDNLDHDLIDTTAVFIEFLDRIDDDIYKTTSTYIVDCRPSRELVWCINQPVDDWGTFLPKVPAIEINSRHLTYHCHTAMNGFQKSSKFAQIDFDVVTDSILQMAHQDMYTALLDRL